MATSEKTYFPASCTLPARTGSGCYSERYTDATSHPPLTWFNSQNCMTSRGSKVVPEQVLG
jgi:hypothetical protein